MPRKALSSINSLAVLPPVSKQLKEIHSYLCSETAAYLPSIVFFCHLKSSTIGNMSQDVSTPLPD